MISNASYFVCGFNIEKQITPFIESDLPYICCPVKFPTYKWVLSSKKPVQISLSHIFWNEGNEWKLSGHKARHLENIFHAVSSSLLVRSSEKRHAFLTENGDVMVSSALSTKKLYLQQAEEHFETKMKEEKPVEIEDIALEDNCILCLSKSGKVFSSGVEIILPGIKIGQVSVGKEHCLALTTEGKVLSWGSGMRGQLGNGEVRCVDEPQPVASLEGLEVVDVCCGGWHSVALTASGDAYLWGWNDVGQLGFRSRALRSDGVKWDDIAHAHMCLCPSLDTEPGSTASTKNPPKKSKCERRQMSTDQEYLNMINDNRCMEIINVQASPKLLDFWTVDYSVKKVACGDRHAVFLLENGTAWTTGWNMYGQLGLGSTTTRDEPQIVDLDAVEDIFAGGWNSVFVAASRRRR